MVDTAEKNVKELQEHLAKLKANEVEVNAEAVQKA